MNNGTAFDIQSTWTMMLPYIEQENVYKQIDLNTYYLSAGNQAPFQASIKPYICPSNPSGGATGKDTAGYGTCDYMPVAYNDLHPTGGYRANSATENPVYRSPGMLTVTGNGFPYGTGSYGGVPWNYVQPGAGTKVTSVTDGTSNTIAIIEDVGRGYFGVINGTYDSPAGGKTLIARWAEPDQANGVSGPRYSASGGECYSKNGAVAADCNGRKVINNNSTPVGGPSNCPWSSNNCGPNDEPFSFHTGGAQAVFGDGHVAFVRDSLSPTVMRTLLTPNGGDITGDY